MIKFLRLSSHFQLKPLCLKLFCKCGKLDNYLYNSLFDQVNPIIQDYANVMDTALYELNQSYLFIMNAIKAQKETLNLNKENILQTSDISISLIKQIDVNRPDQDILKINQQIKEIQQLETYLNKVELEFKQDIQQDRILDQKMIGKQQALKNEILEKIDKVQDSLNNYINNNEKQNQKNSKIQLQNKATIFRMQQTLLTYLSKHIKTSIVKSKQFEQQYYKSQQTLEKFRNDFENLQNSIKPELIYLQEKLENLRKDLIQNQQNHQIKQQQYEEIQVIEKKIVQLFEGLEQKTQLSVQKQLQDIDIYKQDLQETANKYQQLIKSAQGSIPKNFNTLVLTFFNIQENEFYLQHQMLLKQQQRMAVNSTKLTPLPKINQPKSWKKVTIFQFYRD